LVYGEQSQVAMLRVSLQSGVAMQEVWMPIFLTKRVLVNSNGQWMQETFKVLKQCSVPKGRSTTFGMNCYENMAPRALFDNNHNAFCIAKALLAASLVTKKRERGEDNVTRTIRSITEAKKITTFLRSPATRVHPDETREYFLGMSCACRALY